MKIETEKYERLKSMLESTDQENLVVAMECIEQVDFRENMTMILFLIKDSNVDPELWKKHAPITTEKFFSVFSVGIGNASLAFSNIMRLMKLYEASIEDWQFYADRYAQHLMKQIQTDGPGLEVIITIKHPLHE
jgi:N-acetylglutamate synthase/N-acetylornithine aminotransferase